MSAEPAAVVTPTRPRWRRWILLALLVAGTAWFGYFAYLRITLKPTPRPDYWAAKYAELVQTGPDAVTLGTAQSILNAKPWVGRFGSAQSIGHHSRTVLTGAWDDQRLDVRAVGDVFTSQSFLDDVAAVRRLAQTGWMAPYVPQFYSLGLYSWQLQAWCNWLLAHSRWVMQERHDVDAVIEDWLTALRLAGQVNKERTVESTRHASGLWRSATSQMLFVAVEDAEQIDALGLALQVDTIVGSPIQPMQLLAGEWLGMHAALEDVYVRWGGDWLAVNACALARHRWIGATIPSRLWNLTSPLFHDLDTARANVEHSSATTDQFGNLIDCGTVEWPPQSGDRLVTVLDGLPDRTLQSAAFALSSHYKARCQIDAAMTLLAINQYRRETGHCPDGLDDLVPEYLPRRPIDYADMQPLRYRREGDGFVLYSIGADGVDHGGRAAETGFTWPESNDQADAVFSLARRPERTE